MADRTDAEVTFRGTRSGEGPLTWGQHGIWIAMARNRRTWNLEFIVDVSDLRVNVPSIVEALGQLFARHESLRTLIRVVDGVPRQVVLAAGALRVPVVPSPDGESGDTAERLMGELVRPDFRPDVELPVRISLVVVRELVRHVVFVHYHGLFDRAAARIVHDDLRCWLATGSFPGEPGLQPLDLARREQSDGVAVSARAVRYWTDHLRRLPPGMWSPVGPAHEPRNQQAVLTSTALRAAAQRLATRYRNTPSTVLLAATAAVMGAWTGHRTVALNLHAGNRFRPEFRRYTSNLVQLGLFVLDLPTDGDFTEVLRRAVRSALLAYRYSYYDQLALERARAKVDAERGAEINPFACFNILDKGFDDADHLAGLSDQDIRARRTEATLERRVEPAPSRCPFCVKLGGLPGAEQPMVLSADTRYLPPDRMDRFLREVEDLVITSAVG